MIEKFGKHACGCIRDQIRRRTFDENSDKIEEYLCICCLVIMTALVFANVFSRYILHASFSFSEEITTNLFVLLSMMGTAIAAKRQAHLGLSLVPDRVSP